MPSQTMTNYARRRLRSLCYLLKQATIREGQWYGADADGGLSSRHLDLESLSDLSPLTSFVAQWTKINFGRFESMIFLFLREEAKIRFNGNDKN